MTREKSDHFDGRRFVNPRHRRTTVLGGSADAARAADAVAGACRPAAATAAGTGRRGRLVTFIGHATFLIQTAAGNILTDPMYSQRAGPLNVLGPRRVRQPAVRFDDLPPISTVLLSHNHYDHCDLRTLGMLAERFDPIVVTPLGNGALVRSSGIRQVEELDWWQAATTPCCRSR